ncbi:MAG: PIN domain-containing protein [Candidatus Hydrothermarchaeaceae archaeon]
MFLDTTILIEFLRGNRKVIDYLENIAETEPLLFSIVQTGGLADWCHANKLKVAKVLKEVKGMATVTGITESICIEGSKIKQGQRKAGKNQFGLMDGFIIASAMSFEQTLLTTDPDFEGLDEAIVL